jgi:quercetin dioxygenase-like cupin family protein/hemerythrin superfamily protein
MRRHPALVPLSHDHHHGLALARRLTRAQSDHDEREAASAFAEFIAGDGSAHFREEEEILFPLIGGYLDASSALIDRAVTEHAQLRSAAIRFERLPIDLDQVRRIGRLLAAHIKCEEREIFPLAQRVLPEHELETIRLAARVPPGSKARIIELNASSDGPLRGIASSDLNVTPVSWQPGAGVTEHRNTERDVLVIVTGGGGTLRVDHETIDLTPPRAVVIPKHTTRAITAGPDGLQYLSVHLRRNGLVQIRR